MPVPEGRVVDSPADAWEAAEDVGVPVVVKPTDGNHGRGVFTNLTTQAEVEAAYASAINEGSGVLVERYINGSIELVEIAFAENLSAYYPKKANTIFYVVPLFAGAPQQNPAENGLFVEKFRGVSYPLTHRILSVILTVK